MSRNFRILAIIAVIIVIVGAGAFLYLTQPAHKPAKMSR